MLVSAQVPIQRYKWTLNVSLWVGPAGHYCKIPQLILTSLTEESHKDIFNECPTGPNLDLLCIQLSNAAPFCKNYAKLYFDAKHLEKGLNRGWRNFWGPFWPISNAALNF